MGAVYHRPGTSISAGRLGGPSTNAYLTTAQGVGCIDDFAQRCAFMPTWNEQTRRFVQDDRQFCRSNVVMPDSGAVPLQPAPEDRHNAVGVNGLLDDNGGATIRT